ncbi:EAL domain-containing protein [Aeromicrobium sp.]|uniref:sensor domain-containing phosphodiesterase n=1 Tax=Aeromicrobium sp. TaxID=1871063 RepID=UPI00199CB8F4|nr:EAL domain-containing protein [Aeromicrobium sp.]MBC7632380.1 EAL domain-containing protein [Aeromicrobium sp.]
MPLVDEGDALLDDIVRSGDVRSLLQPIVDLSSGDTVAYEALARGPHGSPLERPDRLLAKARAAGRLDEVDRLCRVRAIEAGRRAGLVAPHSLFVNVEPDSLHHLVDNNDLLPHPPTILELTERALSLDPALLIRAIAALRELGWAFAIDDLGVNTRSLALLPLIAPDIIKLDMSIVQNAPDQHAATIMSAVAAHSEATGALILAEGIETAEHIVRARALGADLGQGWLFGPPAEADTVIATVPGLSLSTPPIPRRPSATPYEIAVRARAPKIADKLLLLELSTFLESRAQRDADSAVIVSAIQHADNLTPATVRRYRELASLGALVIVLAKGISAIDPLSDMHAVDLAEDEPLTGEWAVAVISTDFAALLAAREMRNTSQLQFEFVLTHDRRLVLEAAHSLFARLRG